MDLDKLEERLIKVQKPLKKTTFKLMGFQKNLIKGIILYAIIMYVFIAYIIGSVLSILLLL